MAGGDGVKLPPLPDALQPSLREKLGLWALPGYLRRVKGILMADAVNLPKGMVAAKTKAAGAAGVIATLVCTGALFYFEVTLDPEEVAAYIGATITIATFLASYFKRTSAKEVAQARLVDGTVVQPQTPGEVRP